MEQWCNVIAGKKTDQKESSLQFTLLAETEGCCFTAGSVESRHDDNSVREQTAEEAEL
jgi:hypothetical protein